VVESCAFRVHAAVIEKIILATGEPNKYPKST